MHTYTLLDIYIENENDCKHGWGQELVGHFEWHYEVIFVVDFFFIRILWNFWCIYFTRALEFDEWLNPSKFEVKMYLILFK